MKEHFISLEAVEVGWQKLVFWLVQEKSGYETILD
jgi:hypothetical protein